MKLFIGLIKRINDRILITDVYECDDVQWYHLFRATFFHNSMEDFKTVLDKEMGVEAMEGELQFRQFIYVRLYKVRAYIKVNIYIQQMLCGWTKVFKIGHAEKWNCGVNGLLQGFGRISMMSVYFQILWI